MPSATTSQQNYFAVCRRITFVNKDDGPAHGPLMARETNSTTMRDSSVASRSQGDRSAIVKHEAQRTGRPRTVAAVQNNNALVQLGFTIRAWYVREALVLCSYHSMQCCSPRLSSQACTASCAMRLPSLFANVVLCRSLIPSASSFFSARSHLNLQALLSTRSQLAISKAGAKRILEPALPETGSLDHTSRLERSASRKAFRRGNAPCLRAGRVSKNSHGFCKHE